MPTTDVNTLKYAFWIVIAGLASVVLVFGASLWRYGGLPQDVVAVLGAVTAVIGTLVGTFFGVTSGVQAGSAGRAQAEAARDNATRQAIAFAATSDPARAESTMRLLNMTPTAANAPGAGQAAADTGRSPATPGDKPT